MVDGLTPFPRYAILSLIGRQRRRLLGGAGKGWEGWILAAMAGVIAIDGQVAAGKTAAGRELARRLGCPYLDTGIMYRAVAWQARRDGVDPSDAAALGRLAVANPIQFKAEDYTVVLIDGQELRGELRTPEMDRWAAMVARAVPVRRELVRQQRAIAAAAGSIVMVGRDIGAVALPEADLKVYMRAAPEVRARRRYAEMTAQGQAVDFEQVLAAAMARDESDSQTAHYYHQALPEAAAGGERDDAAATATTDPVQAAEAWPIDTGPYTVSEVVDLILERLAALRRELP